MKSIPEVFLIRSKDRSGGIRRILCLVGVLSLSVWTGCDESESSTARLPPLMQIESILPSSVKLQESFRIEGTGFGIEGVNDGVWVSGKRMPIIYWTTQTIDVRIPASFALGAHWGVIRANDWVSDPFELFIEPIE